MSKQSYDDFDQRFDRRSDRLETMEALKAKGLRFLRYLSTRKMECWGFFAAGFLIATIF